MAERTDSFTQTLNTGTKTSDSFKPLGSGGVGVGFMVSVVGTFVANWRLQRTVNGTDWFDYAVFDASDMVAVPAGPGALWRFSASGVGDFTSGSAVIAFARGGSEADASVTRLQNKDGTLASVTKPSPVSDRGTSATDRAGTITTGGTAQNALAANTSRAEWNFVNNSDTVMMVRIGAAASATAGIRALPNDLLGGKETNAISVYCATTGKAFTAWER